MIHHDRARRPPARQAGFGTEGLFTQSNEPVRGVVALSDSIEEPTVSIVRVRLPAAQEALSAAIVELEKERLAKVD